jgi:hypothetical protein
LADPTVAISISSASGLEPGARTSSSTEAQLHARARASANKEPDGPSDSFMAGPPEHDVRQCRQHEKSPVFPADPLRVLSPGG